ncbi:heavy-metal-associated domain-containing protein [Pasteurella bettyae]|uniref:Heavy metal-associated domain protein n=1 Tax=Pasteurella bettyae CCUG 2042 TaxID=1095749 RepID=I3D6P8_9PAST|nr:heavy-metal-associated domain-containing protein [Pasteurella bettyae]EIJ67391.1 heavy metal-associated domain protein [Pasteurella bettyae CCUG 2042]SUB21263.1 protein MerP [Pasteurella bettyae]
MKKFIYILFLTLGLANVMPLQASETVTTQTLTEQREVSLFVDEMTCQLCVYLVNKELRAIDGVISTKATMKDKIVKVIVNNHVSNEQLIKAIQKLKYTAKVI